MPHEVSVTIAPSPELLLFAERHAQDDPPHAPSVENRCEPRPPLFVPVIAQPLSGNLAPLGKPLAALTRNVSRHGLSLIVEDWPQPDLLAIQLVVEGEECCLLVTEKWRRQQPPFAVIGLRTVKLLHAHTYPLFVSGHFFRSGADLQAL